MAARPGSRRPTACKASGTASPTAHTPTQNVKASDPASKASHEARAVWVYPLCTARNATSTAASMQPSTAPAPHATRDTSHDGGESAASSPTITAAPHDSDDAMNSAIS